jgi:hypothetical protein
MHFLFSAANKRNRFLAMVVVGALALVSLPAGADRINVKTLKKGITKEIVRGRMDRHPDKSVVGLPSLGQALPLAADAAAPPIPATIVSPFIEPSSRSNSMNYGFLVGNSPFATTGVGISSIKTFVAPIVITVHQVATDFGVDADGNLILTGITNQDATFDPTQPSPACLGKTNNVPFTLAVQSPNFTNLPYVWGGTNLGTTQYGDAFQRANYWKASAEVPHQYHMRLSPVEVLPPVVLDFPVGTGIALPQSSTFAGYSNCAPTVLVDFAYFDALLDYQNIPNLASSGVNSGNFPIFVGGNVLWGQVIGELPIFNAQAAGYHSFSSVDPAQTYAVMQFGDENFFTWPDAVVLSHEIGEWMNDPTGSNETTAYTISLPGSAPYCQSNYEVGDALAGTFMPPIKGSNGYTYTVQELAFFSYFYGGPSFGVNGWYSSNDTFKTDAGAVCSPF